MHPLAAPALKFVGGLAQSGLNFMFNKQQQASQNAYNERMIDKQNSYNSPNAIKNRLIMAGITPKLAELSLAGVPSAGLQSSVNTATPYVGEAPATDFRNAVAQSYQNELIDMQGESILQNMQADVRLKNAQADSLDISNKNAQRGFDDEHAQSMALVQNYKKQNEKLDTEIDINKVQKLLLDLDKGKAEIEAKYYDQKVGAEARRACHEEGIAFEDFLFASLTLNTRVKLTEGQLENLTAERQKLYQEVAILRQTLNSNMPDEEKAKTIERLRKEYPKLAAILDVIDYVTDKTGSAVGGVMNLVK